VVVAIDGRSGSGKSTVAQALAPDINAAIVPDDDFFAANVSDIEWDTRTPEQRAAEAIDWRRLKREAIEPLRAGRPALWYALNLQAGPRSDGTFSLQEALTVLDPRPVVLLDGAYSARPELADVLDVRVPVEAVPYTRQARLEEREAPDILRRWHARWDAAEQHYFTRVRPPTAFDVVIRTDDVAAELPYRTHA
jgi:uridine kinase